MIAVAAARASGRGSEVAGTDESSGVGGRDAAEGDEASERKGFPPSRGPTKGFRLSKGSAPADEPEGEDEGSSRAIREKVRKPWASTTMPMWNSTPAKVKTCMGIQVSPVKQKSLPRRLW